MWKLTVREISCLVSRMQNNNESLENAANSSDILGTNTNGTNTNGTNTNGTNTNGTNTNTRISRLNAWKKNNSGLTL